jgi:thiamine-phosphate pyrophosphorylase
LSAVRGLYAIVDVELLEARKVPVVGFAERVLAARPGVIQLRAKASGAREMLDTLRRLRPLCATAGVPLFANDRPDLAVLARCDGVHVGQEDLPVAEVRRFAPTLRVGVSTHDLDQLRRALDARPDYVAFGPVFPTTSKSDPSPVTGLARLAEASVECRAAGIPLVAIGGIDASTAARVGIHADLGAAISALFPPEGLAGVTARASLLHAALRGAEG